MSRGRRRPRRNIWSEPPQPVKPFDYEESLREPEPEPPEPGPAPQGGVFDVVRYNTPVPPAEPRIEEMPRSETGYVEDDIRPPVVDHPPHEEAPAPEPTRSSGRHLSHRRVVIPRGRRRGRHSLPPERDEPSPEQEPLLDPAWDVSADEFEPEREPEMAHDVDPDPAVDDAFEPARPDPATEPEPDPEPVAEPEPEPVAELEPERVAEPEAEPVAELEPERVAEPEAEPVAELEPEPVVEDDFEWPGPAPDDWDDHAAAEAEVEAFETETPEQRRQGRHLAEKRMLFPRRVKPGRHSLSAPAASAPPVDVDEEGDAASVAEEPEPFAATDEPPDAIDDATDEPGFSEEIAPYEPEAPRRSRRKRRGRHLGPAKRTLLPQKTRPGRHSMKAAPPPPVEEVAWVDEEAPATEAEPAAAEAEAEAEPEAPVSEAEPEAAATEAEPEAPQLVAEEDEPRPEPEPVVEVIDEEFDEEPDVEDELVDDLKEAHLEEVDAATDLEVGEVADEEFVDFDVDEELDEDVTSSEPEPASEPAFVPRRARTRRRRRERIKRFAVGLLTALVVGSMTVGVGVALDDGTQQDTDDGDNSTGGVAAPIESASTTLLYGIREDDEDRGAIWVSLLSVDPTTGEGAILYIPAHTAVEVPGRGLLPIGESLISGGPALMLVSAENLLGVRIDRYVELSDRDARILFSATGPLTIDVPAEVRVPAGPDQARLIFVEGPQELSATFLSRLLYTRGLDTDDVEFGSRLIAFWDALFDAFEDDPEALGAAVREAGAALVSDQSPEETALFFEELAGVANDMTLTSIPVNPVSAGDDELYATEATELASLIEETLGETAISGDEVRVQVLNGNGEPGIGQEVAERLVGQGFRVILSGNARTLDYETTLIVTYDDSPDGIALAERAREVLGLGEVQVSRQTQGIVDLTIVIGKDFLAAE